MDVLINGWSWVFLLAVVFYALSLVRWGDGSSLGKVPWVILGHIAVALGLCIVL